MSETPFRNLALDRSAERSVANLRLAAAAITLVCSIGLATMTTPSWVVLIILAGLLVSALWVAMFFVARRRIGRAAEHFLTLDPERMTHASPKHTQHLAWSDVASVEVDEDRLVVAIKTLDEREITIEPRYGELGVYDLREAVRDAWQSAESQGKFYLRMNGEPTGKDE